MSSRGSRSKSVLDAMDRVVRSEGFGSVRRAERAVGKTRSWWQGRVRAGDLQLSDMLAILDHCGLDEGTFLNKSLGKEDSLGLDRPTGDPPEIVTRAQERLAKGKKAPGLPGEFLSSLDEERYSDWDKAAEMALWAVDKIEDALLPRLLGVAGSTYRLQMRLREAHHSIYTGLKLVRAHHDPLAEANLIQRLAYVVADHGHHKAALCLSRSAAWAYLEQGDRAAMGTALVDQGIWLSHLGQFPEAIELQHLSLEFLLPGQQRSRCAAYQALAIAHDQLGELREALGFITEALTLKASVEPLARCKISWLKGGLLAGEGKLASAEEVLGGVVAKLRTLHPGECASAACDLVSVQLKRGRAIQAYAVATSMISFLEPLRGNRIISAAIAELLRGGREGLDLARVSRVLEKLKVARDDRTTWHSLLRK